MAKKTKSVIDIDREIEALKAQRVAAVEGRADQIGTFKNTDNRVAPDKIHHTYATGKLIPH